MPALGPLGRVGSALWELLGLSKASGQNFTGVNAEIQPTINVTPFLIPEIVTREILGSIPGGTATLGANAVYTNTNNFIKLMYGVECHIGAAVGAGVQIEAVPFLQSPEASVPFYGQIIGAKDFASGASENLLSGGIFFDSPIPVLPGWKVGVWISTLVGAPPTIVVNGLVADLIG